MNINIAICDDEKAICTHIEETIINSAKTLDFQCGIELFFSGETMKERLENEKYDLIFLDIELPGDNGVSVGKYIRETLKNEQTQIAYISAKEDYAMELFEYRPINFLVKPLDEEEIQKVLKKFLTLKGINNDIFSYKKGREYNNVNLSDVLYFESKGKKIEIVTKKGKDEFYAIIGDVYSGIKKEKFLFIHRSIIINANYIKKMEYHQVTMVDNIVLPISQSRRKATRSKYMNIVKGEYE